MQSTKIRVDLWFQVWTNIWNKQVLQYTCLRNTGDRIIACLPILMHHKKICRKKKFPGKWITMPWGQNAFWFVPGAIYPDHLSKGCFLLIQVFFSAFHAWAVPAMHDQSGLFGWYAGNFHRVIDQFFVQYDIGSLHQRFLLEHIFYTLYLNLYVLQDEDSMVLSNGLNQNHRVLHDRRIFVQQLITC